MSSDEKVQLLPLLPSCFFTVNPTTLLTSLSFSGSSADTKIAADAIASAFSTSPVDIPGVGDKSFFIDAGIVGELVVFSGKSQIIVAIGGLDEDTSQRKDHLVTLAKKLLS